MHDNRTYALICLTALLCQSPTTAIGQTQDQGDNKAIANIARMMAACPNGQRTSAQQRECKRVIDSIQADRKRTLDEAELTLASRFSEAFLMDESFVADDDGRKLAPDRWFRIGTTRSDNTARARVTMRVGRTVGAQILVGAVLSEDKDLGSVIVRLDCSRRQGQVIQVYIGDNIHVDKPEGIGPWLPLVKSRSVLQAIGQRVC
jgi:hypothetical protein